MLSYHVYDCGAFGPRDYFTWSRGVFFRVNYGVTEFPFGRTMATWRVFRAAYGGRVTSVSRNSVIDCTLRVNNGVY